MTDRILTARSLLGLIAVDDPRVSPCGRRVAWIETRFVAETDATVRRIVLAPSASRATDSASQVVWEGAGVRCLRWSPDSRWLTFVTSAPSGSVIERVGPFAPSRDGADVDDDVDVAVFTVATVEGSVQELAWSPRGDALALIVARSMAAPLTDDRLAGVLRVTRLRWKRDGVGLVGDRFDHLGVLQVNDAGVSEGSVQWLVQDRRDVSGPAWSPDGSRLAFVGELDDPRWELSRRASVYVTNVDGGEEPRRLARFADVRGSSVSWSPSGDVLAVLGHMREGFGHYAAQRVWLVDARSGATRAVTTDAVGTFGNAAYTDTGGSGGAGPVWDEDGRSLLAIVSCRGAVDLVRVALDGSLTRVADLGGVVAGFDVSADRSTLAAVVHPRDGSPDVVVLTSTAGDAYDATALSNVGRSALGPHAPVLPRAFLVDDGSGPPLDAWMLVPDVAADERVPVVLYTGGGPAGMRSDNFHFEWQVFVRAGYAVVWTNARGCQGYGDGFGTAILGSWGGDDHVDQMRALDAALELEPRLDRSRQGIAGGSYGGYAVVWAIAQETRFRAAVADRAVVDKLAAFGMSDIGAQRAFEFGGAAPWEDVGAYLEQSPIDRLGSVTTPTLVIHSALDHRCTVGQGEALYAGLRARGVPTCLVRFPNESHGLSRGGRPWHRVRRIQAYVDWFDRHLRDPKGGALDGR